MPDPRPAAAPVTTWFERRVRALAPGLPDGEHGGWVALDAVCSVDALAGIESALWRTSGLPPRAALTTAAGWTAGTVAQTIAAGALRDGVVVRIGEAAAAEALVHADGWIADMRLRGAPVAVGREHAWAGLDGADVVEDVPAAAVAAIVAACGPMIAALAARSGRGSAGLWAQVADSVALCAHEPGGADGIAAVQRLLGARGAPWRAAPRMWMSQASGTPVLVHHRGSCCLWYRGDSAQAEEPQPVERDAVYDAAFPPAGPGYCENCLFRSPDDVEARAIFWAGRDG